MNSKDAAKLAFGNPGFLDFLKPITNLVSSNINLVKNVAASNINPTFSAFVNPLLSIAKTTAPLASQIPYIGDIVQPLADQFYDEDTDVDDVGPGDDNEEESMEFDF